MFALSNQETEEQEFRHRGCRRSRCQTHLGSKFARLKKGNLSLHFKNLPQSKVNWKIIKYGCNIGTQTRYNWISCSKATFKLIGVKVV